MDLGAVLGPFWNPFGIMEPCQPSRIGDDGARRDVEATRERADASATAMSLYSFVFLKSELTS